MSELTEEEAKQQKLEAGRKKVCLTAIALDASTNMTPVRGVEAQDQEEEGQKDQDS